MGLIKGDCSPIETGLLAHGISENLMKRSAQSLTRRGVISNRDGSYTVAPLGLFGRKYVLDEDALEQYLQALRRKNRILGAIVLLGILAFSIFPEYYYFIVAVALLSVLAATSYVLWSVRKRLKDCERVHIAPDLTFRSPKLHTVFWDFIDALGNHFPSGVLVGLSICGFTIMALFAAAIVSGLSQGGASLPLEVWTLVLVIGLFAAMFGLAGWRRRGRRE
jgi:hypothetical protein